MQINKFSTREKAMQYLDDIAKSVNGKGDLSEVTLPDGKKIYEVTVSEAVHEKIICYTRGYYQAFKDMKAMKERAKDELQSIGNGAGKREDSTGGSSEGVTSDKTKS